MDGMELSGVEQNTQTEVWQSAQTRPAGTDKAEDPVQELHEMLNQAREKAQERRDSLKLRTNGSQYGDAAMTAYAKLARARSQGEVSAAAGYARRQIARCQAALGSDGDNAQRIKGAIRQLQKAVSRAGKKKRELQREDLIRARERRARMEQERRKAVGLKQELNRRRTMRMIREGGYLREAEIDNRQQAQMAKTQMELREQAQALASAVPPSLEGAVREYSTAAQAAPPPAAEMDVQV